MNFVTLNFTDSRREVTPQLFHVEVVDERVVATPVRSETALHDDSGLSHRGNPVLSCYAEQDEIDGKKYVMWSAWGWRNAGLHPTTAQWLTEHFGAQLMERVFATGAPLK